MIERIDNAPAGVIGLRASGELTKDDYRTVLEPALAEAVGSGEARVLFVLESFDGLTAGAISEDIQTAMRTLVRDHDTWRRLAFVTDVHWVARATELFAWMAPGELRVFGLDQRDEAETWGGGLSRLIIRGGAVLTQDPALGELTPGDVLVEDDRIAAVGPELDADAEVLDATGCVVLPGFVDTHRHTWQTALRGICADWTLDEYFRGIRQTLSPRYTPEDVHTGNHAGALEALDAGVTTLLDFSHCMNSPAHADAALQGLLDAGIRAVFAYGYFPTAPEPAGFAGLEERLADAARIRAERLPADDGLVTMGIALTELGLLPLDMSLAELRSAAELDALVVAHTGCVWGSELTKGIHELHGHGLLGPGQVHVHCNALDDDEFDLLAGAGAAVSCSPETELQMGMGHPAIGRCLERGMRPSLSCDIVSLGSGDLITQMRMGLQDARARANDALHAEGAMPEQLSLTVRDALRWGTIDGAAAMGLDDRTGSLTPGKQADVVVIGSDRLPLSPAVDPAALVVVQASGADVRDVLVAGRVVKRDGVLTGIDRAAVRRAADASRERVIAAATAGGGPLLPDPIPGFAEALDGMARANLGQPA